MAPLTDAEGWRTPYLTAAALALAAAIPTIAAGGLPRVGHAPTWILRDRSLVAIGLLQAATFGLVVVAGNWAVPLLERQEIGSAAAGMAAGLILFAGVVTRPLGGVLAFDERRRSLIALALLGIAVGAAALAVHGPYALSLAGAFLAGISAGLPFAVIFAAAQRARPDAPAAAAAFVNAFGVLTILVGTPLAGLAFELPGEGSVAFAAIAVLAAVALVPLRAARR
ncbi:MAG TPA: hypothetical protein VMK83_05855 [Gaiellaceae bacterium]|nr:hypothetical protein [Gaiellaceae bacterium]